MTTLIIILHVIVCFALILIVLLQTGKGADMGAAFGGGGSQTLFGTSGAGNFLTKATTAAAIIFMLTSLTLAYLSGHRGHVSVPDRPAMEETVPADMPQGSEVPAPAPAETGANG